MDPVTGGIQIDRTFNFICSLGFPGKCLYDIFKKKIQNDAQHHVVVFVITFMKTFSWKSLKENQVKGNIYLDKLVTGSIYVITYKKSMGIVNSPQNPGSLTRSQY